jgi:hypothetical protein
VELQMDGEAVEVGCKQRGAQGRGGTALLGELVLVSGTRVGQQPEREELGDEEASLQDNGEVTGRCFGGSKQRRPPMQSLARIRVDGGGSESMASETRL